MSVRLRTWWSDQFETYFKRIYEYIYICSQIDILNIFVFIFVSVMDFRPSLIAYLRTLLYYPGGGGIVLTEQISLELFGLVQIQSLSFRGKGLDQRRTLNLPLTTHHHPPQTFLMFPGQSVLENFLTPYSFTMEGTSWV